MSYSHLSDSSWWGNKIENNASKEKCSILYTSVFAKNFQILSLAIKIIPLVNSVTGVVSIPMLQ
jgi:hypothetical protein